MSTSTRRQFLGEELTEESKKKIMEGFVEVPVKEEITDFQVGDIVEISRGPINAEEKRPWAGPSMDSTIGKIGVVLEVFQKRESELETHRANIVFDDGKKWWYWKTQLKLIKRKDKDMAEVAEAQKERVYKVGDEVYIVRKQKPEESKIGVYWDNLEMDPLVGTSGKITEVMLEKSGLATTYLVNGWWFPHFILEPTFNIGDIVKIAYPVGRDKCSWIGRGLNTISKVTEKRSNDNYYLVDDLFYVGGALETPSLSKILDELVPLKVGDKVEITRNPTPKEQEHSGWNREMNKSVGKIGIVVMTESTGIHKSLTAVKVEDNTPPWWYPTVILKRARPEARQKEFKPQDTLWVTRRPVNDEDSPCRWTPEMDNHIDTLLTVQSVSVRSGKNYSTATTNYSYPNIVLEKVELQDVTQFSVGDKVLVTRKSTPEECRNLGWSNAMDKTVGKVGTFTHETSYGYRIYFGKDESHNYPLCVLKKVVVIDTTSESIVDRILEESKSSKQTGELTQVFVVGDIVSHGSYGTGKVVRIDGPIIFVNYRDNGTIGNAPSELKLASKWKTRKYLEE